MDHPELPAYRIETVDEYDLITGVELRHLGGRVLHLTIHTTYAHPTIEDARNGVAVRFGDNVAYATIPNLDCLYQTWAEPGRYMVVVVFIPLVALRVDPILKADFNALEIIAEDDLTKKEA
jgi:hypothetical protein